MKAAAVHPEGKGGENSLILNLLSLFCHAKFPVLNLRAIRQKGPYSPANVGETAPAEDPGLGDFPVFFPVSREFGAPVS
jgi:hypothetical protein